jgi:CheY-like chemotaxis protein
MDGQTADWSRGAASRSASELLRAECRSLQRERGPANAVAAPSPRSRSLAGVIDHGRDLFSDARILIVDDQSANVRLLERLLERWGYENLVTTTDSSEVARLCSEVEPDLVLLDLHMPDPGGFRVLELSRHRMQGETRLPVLVLTADVTGEARLRALAGREGFRG